MAVTVTNFNMALSPVYVGAAFVLIILISVTISLSPVFTISKSGLPIQVPSIASVLTPMNESLMETCLAEWNHGPVQYPMNSPILFDFRCITETHNIEYAYFHIIRDCVFQLAPTLAAALNVPIDRIRHVKIITNSEQARNWLQFFTPFLVVSAVDSVSAPLHMYKRMTPGFTSTFDIDPTIPLPPMTSGVMCSGFLRELISDRYMQYLSEIIHKSPHLRRKFLEESDDMDRDVAKTLIESAGSQSYLSRVVLIRRNSRDITNSDELFRALTVALGTPPIIFFGNESEAATAFMFYHAEVIIGYHGAGAANALFSGRGTRIIEVG